MVDKLIEIALAEVGYCEKKNKDNLDSKTANAGDKNYTKYARDMTRYNAGIYVNGYAWCDTFVDWCFTQAFGAEQAEKMLFGWSAYTPTSSGYFMKKGQWHTANPKKGDVIYFKNASGTICHTGIVYKVDTDYVYTVEGNTSSASGVVANGGSVEKKKYSLTHSRIAGYGRPEYPKAQYKFRDFVKDVQKAIGANVDGIAGTETLSKTITVSSKKNSKHPVVIPLQKRLNSLGFDCGEADGVAGKKFTKAVMNFQKAKNCTQNGEITARHKTWQHLLGII